MEQIIVKKIFYRWRVQIENISIQNIFKKSLSFREKGLKSLMECMKLNQLCSHFLLDSLSGPGDDTYLGVTSLHSELLGTCYNFISPQNLVIPQRGIWVLYLPSVLML